MRCELTLACTYPRVNVDVKGFGDYSAENYKQLIDHPVEISEFTQTKFEVAGVNHQMVFTGEHNGKLNRLAKDMKKSVLHM